MKIHRRLTRRGALAALGALAACTLLASALRQGGDDPLAKLAYPKTIVLVRHAEKAAEPKDDPIISEKGAERAQRLATLLGKSGVTHLFASEFQRTQQTLAPLALTVGVQPHIVSARDTAALASAIETLPRGSVVVVAGHSNTVPALLERLTGGAAKLALADNEYDRVFVVTQWGPGKSACALELRY